MERKTGIADSSSNCLPEDVLLYIFGKANPSCICRCRVLNTFWCSALKEYKFLSQYHLSYAPSKQTLILHISFPEWRTSNNAILSVNHSTGAATRLSLPTELAKCDDFAIMGSCFGNLCLTFNNSCHYNKLLIWNILTRSVRQLPQPRPFKAPTSVSVFAFLYYPSSTYYCVVHVFKQNFEDKNIWFTLWNSQHEHWEPKRVSTGDINKVGPDYVSQKGLVLWINFGGHNLQFLEMKGENCLRWCLLYQLERFRLYEQPKLFLDEDIITITQEGRQAGLNPDEIVLSRCSWDPYQRRHLLCQSWPTKVGVKGLMLYIPGLFPA